MNALLTHFKPKTRQYRSLDSLDIQSSKFKAQRNFQVANSKVAGRLIHPSAPKAFWTNGPAR